MKKSKKSRKRGKYLVFLVIAAAMIFAAAAMATSVKAITAGQNMQALDQAEVNMVPAIIFAATNDANGANTDNTAVLDAKASAEGKSEATLQKDQKDQMVTVAYSANSGIFKDQIMALNGVNTEPQARRLLIYS